MILISVCIFFLHNFFVACRRVVQLDKVKLYQNITKVPIKLQPAADHYRPDQLEIGKFLKIFKILLLSQTLRILSNFAIEEIGKIVSYLVLIWLL